MDGAGGGGAKMGGISFFLCFSRAYLFLHEMTFNSVELVKKTRRRYRKQ